MRENVETPGRDVAPLLVVLDEYRIRETLTVAHNPRYVDRRDLPAADRRIALGMLPRPRHLVDHVRRRNVSPIDRGPLPARFDAAEDRRHCGRSQTTTSGDRTGSEFDRSPTRVGKPCDRGGRILRG